jgi:hypothetical protein
MRPVGRDSRPTTKLYDHESIHELFITRGQRIHTIYPMGQKPAVCAVAQEFFQISAMSTERS